MYELLARLPAYLCQISNRIVFFSPVVYCILYVNLCSSWFLSIVPALAQWILFANFFRGN